MSEERYKIEKTEKVIKIIVELPGYTLIQELKPDTTDEELQKEIAKILAQ